MTATAFRLPDRLAAKTDPDLIGADEMFFARLATALELAVAEASDRLAATLRLPGGAGQQALDRDQEVRRLAGRLRTLRRFGLDLCLGRMVPARDGSTDAVADPVYIGRTGLTDEEGRRLLVDWRSPAAEPFFGATHAEPMGLASRRRYRWTGGRITDYWDEVFTPEGLTSRAALDDQSAFIQSLGASRTARMRDVLATIQADQDAVIRADSHGTLVVDGGPGTGKTVVALHRAAYLRYADRRLERHRGGVLFVGPNPGYLAYVDDVLPGLGEDGVQTATLRDLVPEGATAERERDPLAERLKQSVALLDVVEAAIDRYERPPRRIERIETDWLDVEIGPSDWQTAFAAPEPGLTHNEAREQVGASLLGLLLDKYAPVDDPWGDDAWGDHAAGDANGDDPDRDPDAADARMERAQLRRALAQSRDFARCLDRAWPLLDAAGVVADLWSVPEYLRECAPHLDDAARRALHREDGRAWTTADLPLIDAARHRIGDPEASIRAQQRAAALARQRAHTERVIEELIASEHDFEGVFTMFFGEYGADMREKLVDVSGLPGTDPDALAGPFAHVIVDEAQELSDAEWRMLLRRCPSRSFTVVGDRAQARHGFAETWIERLERVGLGGAGAAGRAGTAASAIGRPGVEVRSLTVNYRTPEEVMEVAAPVILSAVPDANVPRSIRRSGVPVEHADASRLAPLLADWLATEAEGVAAVISSRGAELAPALASALAGEPRVRWLTPELSKGLEFDLVVLVDDDEEGGGEASGIEEAVDRYVAMTRATRRLVLVTTG
ncbi:RNA polymerase recycling motor ATPase HelR [Agromyces soli]